MTKISEIIKSQVSFLSEEDEEWITLAMKMYAEWYAMKCIEELDGGLCIVEFDRLTHISSDNSLKRIIQLPKHD